LIEARYNHLTPPDFRVFQNAKETKYIGPLTVDNIQEWLSSKIGIQRNRIRSNSNLLKKLEDHSDRNLVLFLSHSSTPEFKKYLEASQTILSIQDAEFVFAYVEDFGPEIGHLRSLMQSQEFITH
jgi:hypothetical protein